ncbi:chemotaxis protein CheA [Asticcacaulis benevestitus]|uniref:Chemotaxis protein CheA n=1 Tax=Asticcacaulis benevestitus DSM 16100 = ATCC BAA-896 TaxID=1121022 RepID=V4Q4N9_9CAUL|nr:chemotaxis protein CheA [Asticcacaulis benevestitus]ESQ92805.1 hypothetical protein ABENE_06805 [Asticcacaulis benevestitus DSM 16100 = ATCC BAA-896]
MSNAASTSSDYSQFRQTFFAESAEMLADMESKLERLTAHGLDREELDAVFRCVHSIKAGAGMFNYARLVDFAHGFEALLDRMRDGRMQIDTTVANLIIRAADVLSELVSAAQSERAVPTDVGVAVSEELSHLLSLGLSTSGLESGSDGPETPPLRRVEIRFSPRPGLLRHANEPLLVIRELGGLGEMTTVCDTSRLPGLETIDVEETYFAWTFELTTEASDSTIGEVFEFVADDAEISLTTLETFSSEPDDMAEDEAFGLWLEPSEVPSATVEVSATQLDAGSQPLHPLAPMPTKSASLSSIRVDLFRVDRLVNMVGELVISQAMLRQELSQLTHKTIDGLEALDTLTRDLQDCVMAIRMQPVRSVFARMPRLVREVASKLGKHVRLTMIGEQTELDKTVIEELADPLTHMIRNSVDHGIEMPDTRLAKGKSAEGSITLSAAHVGSNILIHLEDDGAGLNRERLYNKAVEKGVIAEGTKLSDEEIVDLIFAPGFSTAAFVSDVSGRGVGMDVVRRNIMKIGGRIQVSSVEGKGTRFTLIIPLTLAVLDGMLISVGAEKYILPLTSIIESFRPLPSQIRVLAGGGRVAHIRGDYVRLIALNRLFDVDSAIDDPTKGLIVLTETADGTRIGIVVDELIGQQQVVIKSLQQNYTPVLGISGATILGDGNVALILDIEQLGEIKEQNA